MNRRDAVTLLGGAAIWPLPLSASEPSASIPAFKPPTPFGRLVGPSLSVTQVSAMGNIFAKYESDFAKFAETRWSADGAGWEVANYYDRAGIFYAGYQRTGDQKWLDRANALALNYRKGYVESEQYRISHHWAQMRGLALHYAITGDEASRKAVGAVADGFSGPYMWSRLSNPRGLANDIDARVQARILTALLYAHVIDAPQRQRPDKFTTGRPWADLLRDGLSLILKSQGSDGAYRFRVWDHKVSSYQTGMLNDALIEYAFMFEKDPRITPSIQKSLDHLWATCWQSGSKSFLYTEPGHKESAPTPDLTGLIVNGFAWIKDKERGDQVFEGAVVGAYLTGSKQFNQCFSTSYRYPAMRSA